MLDRHFYSDERRIEFIKINKDLIRSSLVKLVVVFTPSYPLLQYREAYKVEWLVANCLIFVPSQ